MGAGAGSRRTLKAHRVSYELHCGPIPAGASVLHRCDQPACVNPDHLFVGTQADNMADKRRKLRHRPGSQHPNAILDEGIVRAIRAEYATGTTSLSKLGRKHSICFQHVHDIVRNKIWREA